MSYSVLLISRGDYVKLISRDVINAPACVGARTGPIYEFTEFILGYPYSPLTFESQNMLYLKKLPFSFYILLYSEGFPYPTPPFQTSLSPLFFPLKFDLQICASKTFFFPFSPHYCTFQIHLCLKDASPIWRISFFTTPFQISNSSLSFKFCPNFSNHLIISHLTVMFHLYLKTVNTIMFHSHKNCQHNHNTFYLKIVNTIIFSSNENCQQFYFKIVNTMIFSSNENGQNDHIPFK